MTTQPAGGHHTGSLNLTGEGNAPTSPISDALVVEATKVQHQLSEDEWHGMSASARAYASTGIRRSLEAAYPAIRQQVAEEIAAALDAVPAEVYPEDIFPPDGTSTDCQSARVMRFAYPAAANIAREIGRGA